MSQMEQYNILIVDEDEATRCTLADLLRGRDEYRVLVAGEGHEAVRMFVEEARIDIVLTDIHMPGFNCLELMSDMQRLRHRPEILVMTSDGSAEVIEQARQIGARSIILKPFEHLDLIEAEVEKAVQALFEVRATSSCRMMAPPSVTRGEAVPGATPPGSPVAPPAEAAKPVATAPVAHSPEAVKPTTAAPVAHSPRAAKTVTAAPVAPRSEMAKPMAAAPVVSSPETATPTNAAPAAHPPVAEKPIIAEPAAQDRSTAKPPETVAAKPAATSATEAPLSPASSGRMPRVQHAEATTSSEEDEIFIGNETPQVGRVVSTGTPSATSSPIEVAQGSPESASPSAPSDAGLTMRIDRPDFVSAPQTPKPQPGLETKGTTPLVPAGDERATPAAVTPAAPAGKPGAHETPRSPTAERTRPRVGLPNLGALKTKLFGKRAELSGGHLARGFSDLDPTAGVPVASPTPSVASPSVPAVSPSDSITSPATPVEPAKETKVPENTAPTAASPVPDTTAPEVIVIEEESADSNEPAATSDETTIAAEPIVPPMETVQGIEPNVPPVEAASGPEPGPAARSDVSSEAGGTEIRDRLDEKGDASEATDPDEPVVEGAGEAGDDRPVAIPAELETILAAGAEVDIEKMTLQIPIICLQTWEEQKALDALRPMAGTMKRAFYTWSATRGVVKEDGTVMGEMYCDPIQALEFIRRQKTNGLFVLIDFHNCLEDRKVVRMLREMFDAGETGRGMLVLTAPVIPVPPELGPACQLFDWPPGGAIDFNQVLEEVRSEITTSGGDAIDLDPEARRLLIERVQGMPAGRARFEFLCALRGRGQSGG